MYCVSNSKKDCESVKKKQTNLWILWLPGALFSPSSKNKNKSTPINFLYYRKMELSHPRIENLLLFSQNKAFLIFQERETPKKSLILQGTELFHISGSKFLILKCFSYFRKQNFLYFRRIFQSPQSSIVNEAIGTIYLFIYFYEEINTCK